jgi:hypothetical protein
MTLPGTALLTWARRWFDAGTVARVFEPLVADWQGEWGEAVARRRRRVSIRWTTAFATAVVVSSPRAILLAPMPASMTRRVLARIVIFTGVVSALLMVPLLLELREMPLPDLAAAAFWLLPSSAILAFPFAMTWAADAMRRQAVPTPVERVAAFRIGLMAVILAAAVLGWGMPAANRQFREIAAPAYARPPALGVRELTLHELIAMSPRATADRLYGRHGYRGAIRRELNNRAVFAVLPAVLLWVRWGALTRPRKRFSPLPVSLATAIAICVFFTLYFASVNVEPAMSLQPGTVRWLPIAALALWGVAERWKSPSQAPP